MAEEKQFVATEEAKGQARQLRMFAILAWVVAIAGEIFTILKLLRDDMMTWLIIAIVVILALSMLGSYLWKKSNRIDPASEKDKARFFVQNQLGAIMAVLAFLPLVLFIFTNKNLDGKTKGIAGTIGIVALLVAGIFGVDFNPPSVEKYTQQINEQTDVIKTLNNGVDEVYWTNYGRVYHLYADCPHIKNREQFSGTVKDAWEKKGIGELQLCKTCMKRAEKERNVQLDDIQQKAVDATEPQDP